jgi:hypothetical protein
MSVKNDETIVNHDDRLDIGIVSSGESRQRRNRVKTKTINKHGILNNSKFRVEAAIRSSVFLLLYVGVIKIIAKFIYT